MEVIEYFTGKWKSMENEAGCAWMKEYQGRRLMLHMAVWEDEFLEEWKEDSSFERPFSSRDLDHFFNASLTAMKSVRNIQEQVRQLQKC